MFAGKAGAYLSEAPCRCSSLGWALGLAHKHYTRLERLVRDKRSRLLWKNVTYARKMFIKSWPGQSRRIFPAFVRSRGTRCRCCSGRRSVRPSGTSPCRCIRISCTGKSRIASSGFLENRKRCLGPNFWKDFQSCPFKVDNCDVRSVQDYSVSFETNRYK